MIIKQINSIEAFNSTSIYLDDRLNIDTSYFEGMVRIKLMLQIPTPSFLIYIFLFLTVVFHPIIMIGTMTLILLK